MGTRTWQMGLASLVIAIGGCLPESVSRGADVAGAGGEQMGAGGDVAAGGQSGAGGAGIGGEMGGGGAGGVMATPRVELEPTTVVFAREGSADRPVTITNVGDAVLVVRDVEAQITPEFNVYWFTSTDPEMNQRIGIEHSDGRRTNDFPAQIRLAPADALTLVVNFNPTMDGAVEGYIHLEVNDPNLAENPNLAAENFGDVDNDGNMELVIPLRVDTMAGELILAPSTVDFGRVEAGVERSASITATNIGPVSLVLERMFIDGSQNFRLEINGVDPAQDAAVLADPDGDMIPGVSPDGQFQIDVFYRTDTRGADTGELHVMTDGVPPDRVVNLVANGAAPCINVVPAVLDFGGGLVGAAKPATLTLESCGLQPLRLNEIAITDGQDVFTIREETLPLLPAQLPGVDRALDPPVYPSRAITVEFTPPEEVAYNGTLRIRSDDPQAPSVEVPLRGRGSDNLCPTATVARAEFIALPLDVIELDGSPSVDPDGPDGRPVRYEWVVTRRPEGSTAQPVERLADPFRPAEGGPADNTDTPGAVFFVDLAGEYLIELRVTDSADATAPSEYCPQEGARVTIVAVPGEDIHLQLTWNTPGDADQADGTGADVDLHFMHPQGAEWFDRLQDCFFGNPSPDWGNIGQLDDNPSLDIDDTDGAGPENINLDNPQNTDALGGVYRVGAHYYRSTRGNFGGQEYGPSLVTMRIYLGGVLADEMQQELVDTNDFWDVAGISWGADSRVLRTNRVGEEVPR